MSRRTLYELGHPHPYVQISVPVLVPRDLLEWICVHTGWSENRALRSIRARLSELLTCGLTDQGLRLAPVEGRDRYRLELGVPADDEEPWALWWRRHDRVVVCDGEQTGLFVG